MLTPAFLAALDHVYAHAVQTLDVTYAEPLERAYKLVYTNRIAPSAEQPQRWDVTGSSDRRYLVTHGDGWGCTCPDHVYRQHPCYHILGVQLFCRATRQAHAADPSRTTLKGCADDEEPTKGKNTSTETSGEPNVNLTVPEALKPHIVFLHGKPFVQYAGLLALAHERGLVSLKARFISVTAELALAEAEAVFQDGRTFAECADSTPANVGATVRPAFARMALTRSKARCLRDALNIGICALEELEDTHA